MTGRLRQVATTLSGLLLATAALSACAAEPGGGTVTAVDATPAADACAKDRLTTLTKGKLTIATDKPAYEPWFRGDDPTNGEGFEGAVAYAVAKRLGFAPDEVTWVTATFNNVIQPGPKPFDFDINQVSITEQRKRAVDFSSGYYDVTQAVVAMGNGKIADATSIAGLKGARLGAAVGSTSYAAITETVEPDRRPAAFDSNDVAKAALRDGQIDGLVLDLPSAFYVTFIEIDGAKIVGQLPNRGGSPEQFGLVLEQGSQLTPCVTMAVDALRGSGELRRLADRHLALAGGAPVLK
jgi:polar amino acid transport system substrate-binding protein